MTPAGAKQLGLMVCLGLVAAMGGGCAPSRIAVRPVRYDVDVRIDPRAGTLEGQASVELERLDSAGPAKRKGAVELELHPDLAVDAIEAHGATLTSHRSRAGRSDGEATVTPTTHRLLVEDPADTIHVKISYHGRLVQNVAAGEKEEQVHNFAVSAHIGQEGLFLEPEGYWYPRVDLPEDVDPALTLADYRLVLDPVEGFEMVAGLEREANDDDGRLSWSSPFPLQGLVLLGGPLTRWSRRHGDVELHAVLPADKAKVAEDILDASAEYLDRYQPLIGPYPFKEFTVLEAFFSSGFAFPASTQIAGSQLSEYKQYRRHGYLDHELLHNWWGNGIFVDPRDGNWCEGLASYMGNYYGFVLDGDEAGARKQRRNQSNFLSAIKPEDDKPLGTFDREDGAGRGIGYQKGAAVFHMLERKLGRETLFAGLRRLTAERMGHFASWERLREALETESGHALDRFFEQWVRRGGAPLLELTGAEWEPGSDRLKVTISQGPTDFSIDVPLRLHYGERSEDTMVTVDAPIDVVELPCEPRGLTAVELDPDYHVFRKLKPEETMPTSGVTRRGSALVIVVPEGDLPDGYQVVVDSFTRAVLGDEDEPEKGHRVVVRPAGEVSAADLLEGGVLILGDAVRHPTIREFMARTRCPVTWTPSAFALEGEEHAGEGRAVFLTVHHPDRAEDGVTVYYGNSAAALANARVLNYYPNSLLVFESPLEDAAEIADGSGMPRTRVIRRMDFEFHDRIEF